MRRYLNQLRDRYDSPALLRVSHSKSYVLVLLLLALACGSGARTALAQAPVSQSSSASEITDPCIDPSTHPATKEALRLVCSRTPVPVANRPAQRAVVIGFLGGYTKRSDVKHPEVVFANYLRIRYGPAVQAAAFGNHETKEALELIRGGTDPEKNGAQSSAEKDPVKIILYGHSWGAAQVLEFARELERHSIPVALTIQIDSVHKMGQNDRTVPANVTRAVNFYQRRGLTPGRSLIVAENAERTTILDNLHMTYKPEEIQCDNYGWFSRVFNKPHHQIENDPRIWDQIVTLIDSELLHPEKVEAQPRSSTR